MKVYRFNDRGEPVEPWWRITKWEAVILFLSAFLVGFFA